MRNWLLVIAACLWWLMAGAPAAEGWRYIGDLNGDGRDDSIHAGPPAWFGNAGGLFVVALSQADGAMKQYHIHAHRNCIVPELLDEASGRVLVIWTYWRFSNRRGNLIRYVFGDKLTTTKVEIAPGDNGTPIGNAFYQALDKCALTMEVVPDYVPPTLPDGVEWGK